jgi:hypothetical protein
VSGRLAAALLGLVAACTGTNAEVPLPTSVDTPASYAADVHPILEARCATLDCHGDPGRPLRLYAETGLRARAELRGQPITMDELAENVRAIAGVDPGAPADSSLVLGKPLADRYAHVGGWLWRSLDEPQPACLRGWLDGRSADPAVAAACAAAAPQVALPQP